MFAAMPVCASHTHIRAAALASPRSFWCDLRSSAGTTLHRCRPPSARSATPATRDSAATAYAAPPTVKPAAGLPTLPTVRSRLAFSAATPFSTTLE
jgi:hypothetical protein